ncbi:MAG: hypothetical protein ACO1N3_00345 [Gammaproteobacteria bacterium]
MPNKKLFPQSTANLLKVANKPLSDPDCEIQNFTGPEIFNAFGRENAFVYSENIFYSEDFLPDPDPEPDTPESFLNDLINRLKNPCNESLVVCYIGPDVGYGVFTTKKIKQGDLVCAYGGILPNSERMFAVPDPFQQPGILTSKHYQRLQNNEYTNGKIDATLIGGIGRFIQHAPLHKKALLAHLAQVSDLATLERHAKAHGTEIPENTDIALIKSGLKKEIENKLQHTYDEQVETLLNDPENQGIATANLFCLTFIYHGIRGEVYYANRDIEENEQLLRDYQLGFWKSSRREHLKFFDRTTGYVLPDVSLNRPQPSMITVADSPILSPVSRLRKQMERFKTTQTDAFFKVFDEKHYNRALRIACTSDSKNAYALVSLILAQKELLQLDPNEKPKPSSQNAFEIAEQRGGELYDLLCAHFQDNRKAIAVETLAK